MDNPITNNPTLAAMQALVLNFLDEVGVPREVCALIGWQRSEELAKWIAEGILKYDEEDEADEEDN